MTSPSCWLNADELSRRPFRPDLQRAGACFQRPHGGRKEKCMGRAIEQENSFLQVLLKLIPSEVIAVFVFIQGVMPGRFWPHFVVALLLIGLTPLYLSSAGGVRSKTQLVLST